MNYCYLDQQLGMSSDEVYKLLKNSKGAYYNLETKEWQDIKTSGKVIRVMPYEATVNYSHSDLEDWDEYTNTITGLAWEELEEYLSDYVTLKNIWHAAFILDIATRNCIKLKGGLMKAIESFASIEQLSLIPFVLKNKDNLKKLVDDCNVEVFKKLNILIEKDTFVRF